ncbi:MAG: hypothetical protein ACTHK7_08250 [Aureliella sp.]
MNANLPHCHPRFLPLLAEFEMDELEQAGGTIYGLWPELTLAYMNPAWFRFAEENGAPASFATQWGLGRCIVDAIAEPLRPFFIENYGRCLEQSRPWEHIYECSSANVYREFHMSAFPLRQRQGVLVVNSLRIEKPHSRVRYPPLENQYRTATGIICQCCHCRRTRRVTDASTWDWVAEWVEQSPGATSHGICPECFRFHYSPSRLSGDDSADPFSTINP